MADGAHVVQPVGELHQQHAHVISDGEEELAQVLGLLGLTGDEVEFLQLGQALDQGGDVLAEQTLDLGAGRLRVLDRVVQQRRRDGRVIELEVGEDRGDFQRVGEIGIAGGPLLLAMRPHRIDIGAVEQVLVDLRVIFAHPVDEIVLAHHPLGRRRLRKRLPHHLPMLPRRADACLVLHAREFIRWARHSNQALVASQRSHFPVRSSIRLTRPHPPTIGSRACRA